MLSDIQGQNEGLRVLRRVVSGQLKSPLLLVGPSGVGKRSSVIEAAREAFSKGNPSSPHSKRIDSGVHPDLVTVRPQDGKELGIDAIREVTEKSGNYPSMVSARYVIIDDAETMTVPAANALLKMLEEPPSFTRFFLLTISSDQVLPTIRSRCGVVRYRPLSEEFVVQHIRKLTDDPTKALVAARLGEGSVGLAYQYLASGRLTLRNKMVSLLETGLSGDFSSLFSTVDDIENDLRHGHHFLSHLLCDIIMLPHAPDKISNLDIAERLSSLGSRLGSSRIEKLISGLETLRKQENSSALLPFHTKSYLVNAFSE